MELGDALLFGAAADAPVEELSAGVAGTYEMFDADDDGYSETRVSYTEAGMTVARDRDADGVMDTFTTVTRGGRYESWEIFRAADGTARWEQTSTGEVFE